jgi:CheY-like chemotaxis protein
MRFAIGRGWVKSYQAVPVIVGNAGRLGQVFVNLLVNAAQAITDGSADRNEVRVGLVNEGDRVKITVEDTGSGMPPEVQRRIFDPFFTTKPIGVGSGLGLAICHGIISGHGGEIQVESEEGKGTTFTVWLPVRLAEQLTTETRVVLKPRPNLRRRILVVDDEPLVGKSLRRTLCEHEVEVVTSGKAALNRLADGDPYDLIFCDLMMPEMTGMDLHAEIATRWPRLAERMVFLTGGAFSNAARAFLERVPNRKFEKPYDGAELRALANEPQSLAS